MLLGKTATRDVFCAKGVASGDWTTVVVLLCSNYR